MGNAVQLELAPPPEPSDATHSGGGTGGRNLCGKVQFKKDAIVVIRDTGNDATRLGKDDQRYHTHYMGAQRLANQPEALDESAQHSAETEAHFRNTVVSAFHVARAVVYVSEIDQELYGPHPPAQDHKRRARIQFCHDLGKKYYGRIYVVNGKGIVLHMDSLATNKRDRHEWHRSLEQEEFCRNLTFVLSVFSQMASQSTFSSEARAYIKSFITEEMETKLHANAAIVIGEVAKAGRVKMPSSVDDLLGTSTEGSFNIQMGTTESGLLLSSKIERNPDQAMFRVESLGASSLDPGGATHSGGATEDKKHSHSIIHAKQVRCLYQPFQVNRESLMWLKDLIMIRMKGSDLTSSAYIGEDNYLHWTITVKNMVMTVQTLGELDRAALAASGVPAERIAKMMQWSG